MGDNEQQPRRQRRTRKALLTHTSILILSSFAVGVAVQQILPPEQVWLVLAAGLIGMFGYLGLDSVSRRRAEREAIEDEERLLERIEGRLNKHVPPSMQPVAKPATKAKPTVDWQTLVAVAEKGKQ